MLDGMTHLHRLDGSDVYAFCGLGAFATHAVVPRATVVAIRKDVELEYAALIGCAVATGVGAAMYTAGVRPGESVLVFGCGGVGLNVIQGARLCGATPILGVDTQWVKIWIGQHFGAYKVVMATDDVVAFAKHHTDGRGVDHAFDATGIPSVQERALDCVRPGGTLTLAGLTPMGTVTNFPSAVVTRQEKIIKGSYYGTVNGPRDFPMLVELYKARRLNLRDLVTRRYPLERINEAFAEMNRGEVAQSILVPSPLAGEGTRFRSPPGATSSSLPACRG